MADRSSITEVVTGVVSSSVRTALALAALCALLGAGCAHLSRGVTPGTAPAHAFVTTPDDDGSSRSVVAIEGLEYGSVRSLDSGIIAVRRRLLRAVKENQNTADAAIGLTSEQQRVRSAAMVLPKSESWLRALREHLTVREGVDYTAV